MYKEWQLLSRDWHGLALLFLMPTLFILVMSLALQDQFGDQSALQLEYVVIDQDQSIDSRALIAELASDGTFQQRGDDRALAVLEQQVAADELRFLVVIEKDVLNEALQGRPAIHLLVSPSTGAALAELFAARLRQALAILLLQTLEDLEGVVTVPSPAQIQASVSSRFAYAAGEEGRPSAVQQNVPAWLMFAMFFIAIPLSTTVIRERQNGTLARLVTLGVPQAMMLMGKLLPYVWVNLLQAALMFAVGLWLVPLLGGEALLVHARWDELLLMALAASLAAVSYALLIAELANTTEQATLLSGVSNILLAVLGGVMVPRFIMPPTMQEIGLLSPMAWGLDGFLDLLLRGGGLATAWPNLTALLIFAALMWTAAWLLARRRALW